MDRNYAAFCIVAAICFTAYYSLEKYMDAQVQIAKATANCPKN